MPGTQFANLMVLIANITFLPLRLVSESYYWFPWSLTLFEGKILNKIQIKHIFLMIFSKDWPVSR